MFVLSQMPGWPTLFRLVWVGYSAEASVLVRHFSVPPPCLWSSSSCCRVSHPQTTVQIRTLAFFDCFNSSSQWGHPKYIYIILFSVFLFRVKLFIHPDCFGDISHRGVWLLTNTMELNSFLIVVLIVKGRCNKTELGHHYLPSPINHLYSMISTYRSFSSKVTLTLNTHTSLPSYFLLPTRSNKKKWLNLT